MSERGSRGSGRRSRGAARPGSSERSATQTIAPIYKRLPKGPHGITATGVAHHQRIRMHGAMIEAVATRGYRQTSVKLVIGLAGVSRRAFYEQFANKEDCFLETFDLVVHRVVQRVSEAYRAGGDELEEQLGAALGALAQEVEGNAKALHLAVLDTQTAGVGGLRRLRSVTAMLEGLLSHGLVDSGEREPLALPVTRAIIGGLRGVTCEHLQDRRSQAPAELARELLQWSLLLRSPAVAGLRPRPCSNAPFEHPVQLDGGGRARSARDARGHGAHERAHEHEMPAARSSARRAGTGAGRRGGRRATARESQRAQLLGSAIDLTLRERFDDLSKLRIADEAGVTIDAFMALFTDKQDCYLAALDMLGDEVLQLVASPGLVSEDWAGAVCATVAELLSYLAAHPAQTITLATKSLEVGLRALENTTALMRDVATLLTEGAPAPARPTIAVEAIAGALWHTLYSEVVAGRGHRLPILAEYLSFVVLAPFLGPEEAVQAIVASRPAALDAPAGAALDEVGEHDADEQRDHDHDDQRSVTGAEDPVDLDAFQVEHGEQRDQHGEQRDAAGACQLATTALGLGTGGVAAKGRHNRVDLK
jgi:AcrR family transcriptional regulator